MASNNKRGKNKNTSSGETLGVVIFIIALVFLIFLLTPIAGDVGKAVKSVLTGLFGFVAYALSFCMLVLGVLFWRKSTLLVKTKWAVLIVLSGLIFVCLLQLITSSALLSGGIGDYILAVWHHDTAKTAGGIMFGLIAFAVFAAIGKVGAYIVFSLLLAILLGLLGYLIYKAHTPMPVGHRNYKNKDKNETVKKQFVKSGAEAAPVRPVQNQGLYIANIIPKAERMSGESGTFSDMRDDEYNSRQSHYDIRDSRDRYSSERGYYGSAQNTDEDTRQSDSLKKLSDIFASLKDTTDNSEKARLDARQVLFEDRDKPNDESSQSYLSKSNKHKDMMRDFLSNATKSPTMPPKASAQPDIKSGAYGGIFGTGSSGSYGGTSSYGTSSGGDKPKRPEVVFPPPADDEPMYYDGEIINCENISSEIKHTDAPQKKTTSYRELVDEDYGFESETRRASRFVEDSDNVDRGIETPELVSSEPDIKASELYPPSNKVNYYNPSDIINCDEVVEKKTAGNREYDSRRQRDSGVVDIDENAQKRHSAEQYRTESNESDDYGSSYFAEIHAREKRDAADRARNGIDDYSESNSRFLPPEPNCLDLPDIDAEDTDADFSGIEHSDSMHSDAQFENVRESADEEYDVSYSNSRYKNDAAKKSFAESESRDEFNDVNAAKIEAEKVMIAAEKAKLEAERAKLDAERETERARFEREKLERERLLVAEKARLEAEKAGLEADRARFEAERLERERLAKVQTENNAGKFIEPDAFAVGDDDKQEQARLEQEKLEQKRLESERLAQEKLEKEKLEQEKLENERLAQEKFAQERLEQERFESEKLAQERAANEALAQEKLDIERQEQENQEQERLEQERIVKEQQRLAELERGKREREQVIARRSQSASAVGVDIDDDMGDESVETSTIEVADENYEHSDIFIDNTGHYITDKPQKETSFANRAAAIEGKLNPKNQIDIGSYISEVAESTPPSAKKKRKRVRYAPPPSDLLTSESTRPEDYNRDFEKNAAALEESLKSLKLPAKVIGITCGPAVTRYELEMPPGYTVKKVESLSQDIAYSLASAGGIRIEAPIPGKRAVGVEVPNETIGMVGLRELIESPEFNKSSSYLTLCIGKDILGKPIVYSLEKMPHLLIAGSTGSGKSACLHSLIVSMLYKASPSEVRIILIDPKRVEFNFYKDLRHLMINNIINEREHAINAFKWVREEMEDRYKIFLKHKARNLQEYNASEAVKSGEAEMLPSIIIIVDELSDLMQGGYKKEMEEHILCIAQMARASGVHLILATQRPSVDVITGTIKVNLPSRIALAVGNAMDSKTILDQPGADMLLGRGDLLFAPVDASSPKRIQGAYVTKEEVEAIVAYINENNPEDFYDEAEERIMREKESEAENSDESKDDEDEYDSLLEEIARKIIETNQASTSTLQRRFKLGYARASRIIDQLERLGFIGPMDINRTTKPREIFITREMFKEFFGKDY